MKPVLLLILFSTSAFTAQSAPPSPGVTTPQPQAPEPTVLVYHDDNGIKPPDLLPADFSPLLSNDCKSEAEGIATLSIIIDSSGKPKNIKSLDPFDDDLDRMAVAIAKSERFSPAIKQGSPVALARNLQIYLALCVAKIAEGNGKTVKRLRLKSLPIQTLLPGPASSRDMTALSSEPILPSEKPKTYPVGRGVSPPVPTHTPEPQLTQEDRKIKFNGDCMVSVLVDETGIPHHLRMIRGINAPLDQKALDAVANYRFKPAMAGNRPVPVTITIMVNFKLY
jgi:TonB family protein